MLTINFVYDKNALTVKKFLKTIDCDDVINYMDITNKLTKNDIYSVEPSNAIISSYITKYLEKTIIQKHNRNIFYVLSYFKLETILNIQDFMYELLEDGDIDENILFNAYLRKDIMLHDNVMNVMNKFDNFYELVL